MILTKPLIIIMKQQAELGNKFLSAIEKELDSLSTNPFHQIRYKDYRMLRIRKFPYLLVYYISEDNHTVYISAVFHGLQHPRKRPK